MNSNIWSFRFIILIFKSYLRYDLGIGFFKFKLKSNLNIILSNLVFKKSCYGK